MLKKIKKTGKPRQVSGGHDASSYNPALLDRAYFQSNDPKVKGYSIGKIDVKTVQDGFDHPEILNIKNQSQVVATSDQGKFQVLQTPDGKFYGCHPNTRNPLIINSLFPIVAVKKDPTLSASNFVEMGSIKKMSPGKTNLEREYFIRLSQEQFGNMINEGVSLSQVAGASVNIVNITEPLSRHFAADIAAAELIKLPPVFAVVPKS